MASKSPPPEVGFRSKLKARIVPLADDRKELRVPGKGKGRLRISKDFDEPLPEEVLGAFEGDAP